jgi:hypothetical protein
MGLRNIGKIKETTEVVLYDPASGAVLLNADKSEMTITLYGPYSEQYKAAERAQTNRRLARAQRSGRGITITAEQIEAESFDLLVKCVAGWNITLDKEPEPFSESAVRDTLTEFPWVRAQVDAGFGDTAAFLEASAKT